MFPGCFPSSPSSAEPASDLFATRSDADDRVAERQLPLFGKTSKVNIRRNNGHLTEESPIKPRGTSGSFRTRSSPNLAQENDSIIISDDEQNDETPKAPQPEMHDKGAHSSPFTSYVPASAQGTLWDALTKPLEGQKVGKIYIYRDPDSTESVYKIGMTTKTVFGRMKQHEACCKFIPYVVHSSHGTIEHCLRLEKLIAWDLGNHRMLRACNNRINGHDEWFAVEERMAIKTTIQWEDFMRNEKPYNANGKLSIVWTYLFQKRSEEADRVRELCDEGRHDQWATIFASPTYKDYAYAFRSHASSEFRRFCGWKRESYWQIVTIIYGLWLLALTRNMVAFYALVVVLSCAGINLLPKSADEQKQCKGGSTPAKKNTPTKNKDQ